MIAERLYAESRAAAAADTVAAVTIGLGYTAVRTAAGGIGLCSTLIDRGACCTHVRTFRDFDGAPASELLAYVRSDDRLERVMGIALVNALNDPRAKTMSRDEGARSGVVAQLGIDAGTSVAMVGFFRPVIARLEKVGAETSILDRGHGMGDEAVFLEQLATWPDVLILTATSLIDDSMDVFLERVSDSTRVVVMGPTTPMIPEVFADLPVHMLAGSVVVDRERALAAVRQGGGTPAIGPHCDKVVWRRDAVPPEREEADA